MLSLSGYNRLNLPGQLGNLIQIYLSFGNKTMNRKVLECVWVCVSVGSLKLWHLQLRSHRPNNDNLTCSTRVAIKWLCQPTNLWLWCLCKTPFLKSNTQILIYSRLFGWLNLAHNKEINYGLSDETRTGLSFKGNVMDLVVLGGCSNGIIAHVVWPDSYHAPVRTN